MAIGIYKITNPSGKVYIGQSVNLDRRVSRYRNAWNHCKGQRRLYNSIKKYGWDKHAFEIIEYCEEHQLNDKERYYQEKYNTIQKGLNCKYTETNEKSGKLSEQTKKKIGDGNKGRHHSEETKTKLSLIFKGKSNTALIGRHHSEDSRKKMSIAKEGKSPWNKGKTFSEESRKRMSDAKKGKNLSEEQKKKISESLKKSLALKKNK
jgi:group I intron endonuclease